MSDIYGLDELHERVLDRGMCAACGACVGRCPYLTAFRGKTVVLDQCTVEKGRCFAYCPMTFFDSEAASEFVFGKPYDQTGLGQVVEAMTSRAKDPAIVAAGQGGGTVTALMVTALEERLIDAAVLTTVSDAEGYPHGKVAVTAEEIRSCAGSKFTGAHSLVGLREALDSGYRRIGVVGLPCQVRSLRKMAIYDLKSENLRERIGLVIGLFCNWAFSSPDFVSFLSHRFAGKEVKKFHIPPPPANRLEVETETGIEHVSLDDLRPLTQAACQNCNDMTSEFADVSVGMYEGRPGWNTLITRTELGKMIVGRAMAGERVETDAFPEANLAHLRGASLNKKKRVSENSI
jgi:coenzyme F420 hydrogenase subunit beta